MQVHLNNDNSATRCAIYSCNGDGTLSLPMKNEQNGKPIYMIITTW
jgi:hypothetical protein